MQGLKFTFVFIFLIMSSVSWAESEIESLGRRNYLKGQIRFWVQAYTRLSRFQGYIHDAKYPNIIYEKIDFEGLPKWRKGKLIRASKEKWRKTLIHLHEKHGYQEKLSLDELKLYHLFKNIDDAQKYLSAAQKKRIRYQQGQKFQFKQAIEDSGRYLSHMESIFKKEGVPIKLTRIPFVESSFNINARSKVGASGVWQFIPSTGRNYLKINSLLDERNDPIFAAQAAAKLLRGNYESTGSWGLAVTAYNHGRKSMMRAIRNVGSRDPVAIMKNYRSDSFGFASRNFLSEVLAAIEVEKNAEKYFSSIRRSKPLNYIEVVLRDSVYLSKFVNYLKISRSKLKDLNPSLSRAVIRNRRAVPLGFRLRLPGDWSGDQQQSRQDFWKIYQKIPKILNR